MGDVFAGDLVYVRQGDDRLSFVIDRGEGIPEHVVVFDATQQIRAYGADGVIVLMGWEPHHD